jgi:hypothetical protein
LVVPPEGLFPLEDEPQPIEYVFDPAQGQLAPEIPLPFNQAPAAIDFEDDLPDNESLGNVLKLNLHTSSTPLLRPFNYRQIQSRQSPIDNCLSCHMYIKSVYSHISSHPCTNCYGPILSCQSGPTHNSPYLCYIYLQLYQMVSSMSSSDRFRLLSEFETQRGIWKCAYCGLDTSKAWKCKRPHGIIEPSLGLWIPGCLVCGEKAASLGSGHVVQSSIVDNKTVDDKKLRNRK